MGIMFPESVVCCVLPVIIMNYIYLNSCMKGYSSDADL